MNRSQRALTLVFLLAFAPAAQAQSEGIPDGELAITYRQLQDGQLSQAVFQNYLRCSEGECSLLSLTLNQCIAGKFYPKIQEWNTNRGWNGQLSVRLAAPDVVVAEFAEEGARFQLRFTFATVKNPLDGKRTP
jgi:hypothetical protein